MSDFDFTEFYEWWDEEKPPEGEAVPSAVGWARDKLEALGFTVVTREPGNQTDLNGFHDRSTIHFWEYDEQRGHQHELAHAVVWIAHGRPGATQWGIGSSPYHERAAELERLVFTVEWVLCDRFGEAGDGAEALKGASSPPPDFGRHKDRDLPMTPAMVLEALRLVDLAGLEAS